MNIPCPNAHFDQPFSKPAVLDTLFTQIDQAGLATPLFVKMPHNPWQDFELLLDVLLRHKVEGVTIANLVKNRASVTIKDALPDSVKGGLSGKPTFETSNRLIAKTRTKCGDKLYIIGLGGVFSAKDAQTKLDAGADLVALISGLIFEGPQLVGDIQRTIASRYSTSTT